MENAEYITSLFSGVFLLVLGVIVIVGVVSLWKIYSKAGKPGWVVIIPIYNYLVLLEIVGRPWWWLILILIPCVNLVISIIVTIDLAKSFGKGTGFGLGLYFLPFIFYPILAFGSSNYAGPTA